MAGAAAIGVPPCFIPGNFGGGDLLVGLVVERECHVKRIQVWNKSFRVKIISPVFPGGIIVAAVVNLPLRVP